MNGRPMTAVYCDTTSSGEGPTKYSKLRIPPIARYVNAAVHSLQNTNLQRWKPSDQYGGMNGRPMTAVYCDTTSSGEGPTKYSRLRIPPIARYVTAAVHSLQNTHLQRWKPSDQYGGMNGRPMTAVYCDTTSSGEGPTKYSRLRIPPIVRYVNAAIHSRILTCRDGSPATNMAA
ncbi:hypothetical protein O0L34_g18117 [Tuta absoluta]|nr:hypothetical protein O0L34_g18117 [Tuta absoluta]